jgi:hypothetical protein
MMPIVHEVKKANTRVLGFSAGGRRVFIKSLLKRY